MTHADFFKGRQKRPAEWERPDCAGEPVFVYRGFWDDVDWGVHYCPECESVLAIVSPTHHWNCALTDPKPETLAEGRRLASIAAESKRNASQTAVERPRARRKREQQGLITMTHISPPAFGLRAFPSVRVEGFGFALRQWAEAQRDFCTATLALCDAMSVLDDDVVVHARRRDVDAAVAVADTRLATLKAWQAYVTQEQEAGR